MKRAFAPAIAATALACTHNPTAPKTWLGFAPELTYHAGGSTLTALTTGDVNHDGRLDLLVVAHAQQTVQMLEGLPGGTFKPAVPYTVGTDPRRVDVGDVNGDGRPDLLVIGYFDNGFFLQRGTATGLAPAEPYSLPGHGGFILGTDLNGDHLDDVVVVHDGSGQPVHIKVYLGATSGPLVPGDSFATSYFTSRDLVTGDFNGDGQKDLVVSTGDPGAALLFLRGLGGGQFADPVPIPPLPTTNGTTDGTGAVDVADLNHDGRDDLVVAHADFRELLSIRLGEPQGLGPALAIPSEPARDVVAGDVNGDGNADVLMAHPESGHVSLRLGRGDGTFGDPTALTIGSQPLWLALEDLDGDGALDLVVADFASDNLLVLRNRGWGS